METVLFVLIDLVVLAMIVLIFLKFRLERVGLRVDTSWRWIRTLLSTSAKEMLRQEDVPAEMKQDIKAFLKSRRQSSQVACANKLNGFLRISQDNVDFFADECMRYNEAVQQFNQMLEKPLWHFVAAVFRIKPRLAIERFEAM